jgi:hypothetical protein
LDTRKPTVPFLKVSVSPSVISIGERDYLQDVEMDNTIVTPVPTILLHFDAPTISDTYICANIDIYACKVPCFIRYQGSRFGVQVTRFKVQESGMRLGVICLGTEVCFPLRR